MRASSYNLIAELTVVEDRIRSAVEESDLELAFSLLPLQETALVDALECAEDGRALAQSSLELIQLCLCLAHAQRQEVVTQYSRLANAAPFLSEDRPRGSWGING